MLLYNVSWSTHYTVPVVVHRELPGAVGLTDQCCLMGGPIRSIDIM